MKIGDGVQGEGGTFEKIFFLLYSESNCHHVCFKK